MPSDADLLRIRANHPVFRLAFTEGAVNRT